MLKLLKRWYLARERSFLERELATLQEYDTCHDRQASIVRYLEQRRLNDVREALDEGRAAVSRAMGGLTPAGAAFVGAFLGFAVAAAATVVEDDACPGGEVKQ